MHTNEWTSITSNRDEQNKDKQKRAFAEVERREGEIHVLDNKGVVRRYEKDDLQPQRLREAQKPENLKFVMRAKDTRVLQ